MQSVVATFQGTASPLARLTATHPGTAVRIQVADDILEDGLDLSYEVLGAAPEVVVAVQSLIETQFHGTVKVTQDRPDVWRAFVCLHDLEVLRQHPLYAFLLDHRRDADRVMMVFEAGQCIQRIDFEERSGAEATVIELRARARKAGIHCMVRTADLGRSLEDWRPLLDP